MADRAPERRPDAPPARSLAQPPMHPPPRLQPRVGPKCGPASSLADRERRFGQRLRCDSLFRSRAGQILLEPVGSRLRGRGVAPCATGRLGDVVTGRGVRLLVAPRRLVVYPGSLALENLSLGVRADLVPPGAQGLIRGLFVLLGSVE